MAVSLRIGESAFTGYVGGVWNKDSKSFEVKRGTTKNGKKYQIFEVKVSSKNKESGEYTNGKGIKVMLWGDTPVENGQAIGLVGKLQPDNYTNQEGKEVRGNMLNAWADDMFEPDIWEKTAVPKAKEESDDDMPWN